MNKSIELTKDKREDMISEIKNYFYKERQEDLGDLAASLILDFFMEKLSGEFYNQGIYDAYLYMNERLEDTLGLQKF